MAKYLVSGIINIETTLRIESFPLYYSPVHYLFDGIDIGVAGIGYNIARALQKLNCEISFVSLIGSDKLSAQITDIVKGNGLITDYLVTSLQTAPLSTVIYDNTGKRQTHIDLKESQETSLPPAVFEQAAEKSDALILCNANFNRPYLAWGKENGYKIATDVHNIYDVYDEYNADFMKAADVLFLSNKNIAEPVEDFVKKLINVYDNAVIAVNMDSEGILLYVKKDWFIGTFPPVRNYPQQNTGGASDFIFAVFSHFYFRDNDPYSAIKKALLYASYKSGQKDPQTGFLSDEELTELFHKNF